MKELAFELRCEATLRFVEFRRGPKAARAYFAKKYMEKFADWRLEPERLATIAGYEQFTQDVTELAKQAQIEPPNIVVMPICGSPGMNGSPAMLTAELLLVPESAFYEYDRRQLRAIIAHEIGHIKHGDMNESPRCQNNNRHDQEFKADEFSAVLTGDPEAMISVIKTDCEERGSTKTKHPPVVERVRRLSSLKDKSAFPESRGR